MPHSAIIALLAFAFAMIFGVPDADTTTLYSDLYLSQLCVGYTSLIYDITKPVDRQMSMDQTTDDLSSCLDYGEFYCGAFSDNLSAEAETEIMKFINAQRRSKISNLNGVTGRQPPVVVAVVVPQNDGVGNGVRLGLLQATSRDDHGVLCRYQRVIGKRERLRCGCHGADCAGGPR